MRLLRGHARLTRQLDASLRDLHGLSLNEFEILLALGHCEDGKLRRVDLAEQLVVTQGGITRLLAGLERQGLVEKLACETDGRVVYARLTPDGERRLDAARNGHLADLKRIFSDRFSEPELRVLAELLSRLEADGRPVVREPRAA